MGKKSEKRPAPSYEEGELRDKSIEETQDAGFQPSDLKHLIEKAVRHKPSKEGLA